jgi:hypothetical protein
VSSACMRNVCNTGGNYRLLANYVKHESLCLQGSWWLMMAMKRIRQSLGVKRSRVQIPAARPRAPVFGAVRTRVLDRIERDLQRLTSLVSTRTMGPSHLQ